MGFRRQPAPVENLSGSRRFYRASVALGAVRCDNRTCDFPDVDERPFPSEQRSC
jgi:hypothetical protein